MKKQKPLIGTKVKIVLAVLCVLAFYCVIRIALPKQQYLYEGGINFQQGESVNEYCIYDQIAIPAGVYKIQLQYQTDQDYSGMCTVKDGTVFHGGLKTNGEHLYKGLGQTDFTMWLYEGTEALQVCVSYNGEASLYVGDLLICETGLLWSMLLTVIVCVAILLIAGCLVKNYLAEHPLEKEQRDVLFGLGVIILLSSVTFLYGSSVSGADFTYHLQRIEGVKDGLLSGQFPVRLEPEWVNGHGYANGVLYCNALFLFPALLRLLGFTVTASYNMFGIALNVATALIAYYCFAKIFKNRYIGLFCSGLYTLSVFRIYRLMIVTAVGEGSALTFLPLILYGLYRVFTENPREKSYRTAWLPIAFGYAGIMQTHVLTCEITAFLTIIVCLVFMKKIFCLPTFLELAKGAAGAAVLSLWYLVPFLDYFLTENLHIRHVSARTIQERGMEVMQLIFTFWNGGSEVERKLSSCVASVGWMLVLCFVIFGVLWVGRRFSKEKEAVISLGKVSWILGGMLMIMSLKLFPWDKIQSINASIASLVSSLQFPYRFLGWGVVFLVTVFGCCMWYFQQKQQRIGWYTGIVLVVFGLISSSLYMLDCTGLEQTQFYLYNEEGMGFGYISGEEYLVEGTDASVLTYSEPVVSDGVELENYEKQYLHVLMECSNYGETKGYVELPMLHYTGYRAYTESGEELAAIKGNNNVVRVVLPAGFSDQIEVKFVSPIHWRISEGITYAGWAAMLVYLCFVLRRKDGLKK